MSRARAVTENIAGMGETKLVVIRVWKKCNSNVAEPSRRWGTLAISRQDRVTTLTSPLRSSSWGKKAFLSHQSFPLHYHHIFLWWTTSAATAFDNIYAEKNPVLACLNGGVGGNKYYYTLHAFHEQQFKAYEDEDEVNVILTMTLFT